ncbi:MAG: outer membrane beta-barrel protein [Chitinophagaceae bacterium]|jgi:hypothetical protein
MQHLYRYKIIALLIAVSIMQSLHAQRARELNLQYHDDKLYYFGIALGYNSSHYNITHSSNFINPTNEVQSFESLNTGRIHLGILANLQLTKHIDIRAYPLHLVFSEKRFQYKGFPGSSLQTNPEVLKTESIVMSFPIQVRLKSDRIGNFRFYAMGGYKYDYDLARNPSVNSYVNVLKQDQGIEAGIGCQFFFPYFILSPELKISNGLNNVYSKSQDNIPYPVAESIDQMKSRMIMFTLHFEGGGLGGKRRN